MLLFLLEAARPELRLTENYWNRVSFWVIPVDTIASVRQAGLIEGLNYRPAQATRIRTQASLLSSEAQKKAYSIARQQLAAADADATPTVLSLEERRQVLDLAAEYLRYRYSRREVTDEEFKKQFLSILKVRSRLGPAEVDAGAVAQPVQPEEGHDAGRLAIGGGIRRDRPFLEVAWRPAYHDLLDPDDGFTKGAQINFFAASGRYFPESGKVQLQSFQLVDILSLAPRNLFFRPVSWKVNGGLGRKPFADGNDRLFLGINTGGGLAWGFSSANLFYLMAEADLNLSDRFEDKAALGAGGSAGLLFQLTEDWKAHLSGSALFYGIERHEHYRLALDQSFRLSRRSGIVLHGGWEKSFGHSRAEASVAWRRYY
jgi:hypothetical protein